METSEFEDMFLGQPAIISIDEKGSLVSISLKSLPDAVIEISDEHKKELELQYEDQIKSVLKENYRDDKKYQDHIRIESDSKRFV